MAFRSRMSSRDRGRKLSQILTLHTLVRLFQRVDKHNNSVLAGFEGFSRDKLIETILDCLVHMWVCVTGSQTSSFGRELDCEEERCV